MALIDTIVALLAKAERTDNEHEREAYLAKAQELQTKYAIEQGMIDRARGDQTATETIVQARFCEERNTPLIKAKRNLVMWLAEVNNCFPVMGYRRAYMEITGFESDVRMVQNLYSSILLQLQTAMQAAERRGEPVGTVASWRVSYAHAYVRRVGNRLLAAKHAATSGADSAPGSALVLVNRADRAKTHAEEVYGGLRKGRRIPTSDNNAAGREAGYRDGNRADLGGERLSGSRKEIGS